MAATEIERLNYYQRQFLGAEDFRAQQAYHRDMRRRHNLAHHTPGIVVGLNLMEKPREGDPQFVDVWVQPGFAVDGFGREIVVMAPVKLGAADFDAFANLLHREVWIAYSEELSKRTALGFERCDTGDEFRRLRESYRIVVEPAPPTHESIAVAGKAVESPPLASQGDLRIPADESVPFQEMPDGEDRRTWLVRLGSVNWDGTAGNKKLRPAAAGRLDEGRRYAGVVASDVLAPAKTLRAAPRDKPADSDGEDFAAIEGRLRVDGRIVAKRDLFLHGGKLSFQSTAGLDENAPLWLQRLPSGPNRELRIHIGDDDNEPKNRLTIGPKSGTTEKQVLGVLANDRVEVLTGKLAFGSKTRQMIDLWKDEYGIGVQSGAQYYRSANDFYWWHGGAHDDDPTSAANGQMQMRLDAQGSLHFGKRTRQMLNLWDIQYGIGVQSGTQYFRTAGDFCWFRGGGHSDVRSDPGGGALQMKLEQNGTLTLNNTFVAKGDIQLHGTRLDFRMPDGGDDTDPMLITRFHRGADQNDVRVIIGDNVGGGDRFTVGPLYFADGLYKEHFVVGNDGDVRVAHRLLLDGVVIPVDVRSGVRNLNQIGNGTGTDSFIVTSRLTAASGAEIMVALSDIRNRGTAVNARWRVRPGTAPARTSDNSFQFHVDWAVEDSDGDLLAYSYIVIFTP